MFDEHEIVTIRKFLTYAADMLVGEDQGIVGCSDLGILLKEWEVESVVYDSDDYLVCKNVTIPWEALTDLDAYAARLAEKAAAAEEAEQQRCALVRAQHEYRERAMLAELKARYEGVLSLVIR